ncbi:NUDIX domain-containing protein [Dysgonomonas mossii]|uniref:NUDIX domain-containing protein n=2 Tax=Dysgonomonas mossii TaxID=163665 RepID=A0A4Y9IKS2_9BACT|nr:NUDIX domain-containing protein [Dysgonomonas mossii]MBF0762057.1 NUDIX domain-containing protein [Dysgonomonas mossii]TFU88876.1 NUDIX domain-containing protein [Dysgonomonas mossii]
MCKIKFIRTVGLLVIKNDKLLLAYSNNKRAWYLPGGKIETDELPQQSLVREIWEELTLKIDVKLLKFYCHITAPAYGEEENLIMEQDCYLYELHENISPNNEIGAIKFFDSYSYEQEPAQVIGVLQIFKRLKADGLVI